MRKFQTQIRKYTYVFYPIPDIDGELNQLTLHLIISQVSLIWEHNPKTCAPRAHPKSKLAVLTPKSLYVIYLLTSK